jgi:hypothetical protein
LDSGQNTKKNVINAQTCTCTSDEYVHVHE